MRFDQLSALDQLLNDTSLVEVMDDLETLCAAKAQEYRDQGKQQGASCWDNHAMVIKVARKVIHEDVSSEIP